MSVNEISMSQKPIDNKNCDTPGRLLSVRLYVIISSRLCRKPVLETLRDVISGGADAVQLREKDMSDDEFYSLAVECRKITARSSTLFIVNDRAEIARDVAADGLHVGQSDMPVSVARSVIGRNKILGVSTHNVRQALAAQQEGADYIGAGPLFPTATKACEPPVGLAFLGQIQRDITIPFVAIGGITLENLNETLSAGGGRVAVCSAIISGDNVIQTTQLFRARLDALSPVGRIPKLS